MEAHLREVREAFGEVCKKYEATPAVRVIDEGDNKILGRCFGEVLLPLTMEEVVQTEFAERATRRESMVGSMMDQTQRLTMKFVCISQGFQIQECKFLEHLLM